MVLKSSPRKNGCACEKVLVSEAIQTFPLQLGGPDRTFISSAPSFHTPPQPVGVLPGAKKPLLRCVAM